MASSPTAAAATAAFSAAERLEGAGKNGSPKNAAADAAAKFEELLLFELLKTMRTTIPYTEGEGDQFARGTLDSMMDQALAEASAGGIGVAPMLTKQLGGDVASPMASPTRMPQFPAAVADAAPAAVAKGPGSRVSAGVIAGTIPQAGDLPVDGRKSSDYGWRMHPISHERKFHGGIDLAAAEGTEIRAAQRGVVTFAGHRPGYGKTVEIRHPDGTLGRYAHSSRLHVRVGDRVDAGEGIADVGHTGSATGPHLHFEVRRNGHPIDPQRYLESLRAEDGASEFSARSVGVRVRETG